MHQEHPPAIHERKQDWHKQNSLYHILQLRGSHYLPLHLYHASPMAFHNEGLAVPPGKYFSLATNPQNLFRLFCWGKLKQNDGVIKNPLWHLLLLPSYADQQGMDRDLLLLSFALPGYSLNIERSDCLHFQHTASALHFYHSGIHINYKLLPR